MSALQRAHLRRVLQGAWLWMVPAQQSVQRARGSAAGEQEILDCCQCVRRHPCTPSPVLNPTPLLEKEHFQKGVGICVLAIRVTAAVCSRQTALPQKCPHSQPRHRKKENTSEWQAGWLTD